MNYFSQENKIEHIFEVNKKKVGRQLAISYNSGGEAIREIIQGSYEAKCNNFEITTYFDKKNMEECIAFSDDGNGMDIKDLRNYVNIGFSDKDPNKNIGHKGIGSTVAYLATTTRVFSSPDGETVYTTLIKNTDLDENSNTEPEIFGPFPMNESLTKMSGVPSHLEIKRGVVIVTSGLPISDFIENPNELKNEIVNNSHFGTTNDWVARDKKFPKVFLNFAGDVKDFYAFRRPFSEEFEEMFTKRFPELPLNQDNISTSNELKHFIRLAEENFKYKFIYKEYDLLYGQGSKLRIIGMMGEGICLPKSLSQINGSKKKVLIQNTKDFYRGVHLSKDSLPTEKFPSFKRETGIDDHMHDYLYLTADFDGFEHSADRNKIAGKNEAIYKNVDKKIREKIKEDVIQPNMSFIKSLMNSSKENDTVLSQYKKAIEKSEQKMSVSFANSNGRLRERVLTRKYAENELIVRDKLNFYSDKYVDGIDFQIYMDYPSTQKHMLDLAVVMEEDISYSSNGEMSFDKRDIKTLEMEYKLGNFIQHGHSIETVDMIACWTLGNIQIGQVVKFKDIPVEATLIREDEKYFLRIMRDTQKDIRVYVIEEIDRNYQTNS